MSGLRAWRQFDFSGGVQTATSWLLKRPNEMVNSKNAVFSEEIGAAIRRYGNEVVGDDFETGNTPTGFFTARFNAGSKRMVAVNNSGDTNTVVRAQDVSDGSWDDVITNLPAGSTVFFTYYLDYVYVTGHESDGTPLTPRSISYDGSTFTVSTSTNLIGCPKAIYMKEFGGSLYAINVEINSVAHPDRAYKSSLPLGVITYVKGDQNLIAAGDVTLAVDSVQYLKAGMTLDIYQGGTDTLLSTVSIVSVDKVNRTITVGTDTEDFATSAVNTSTEVITLSSTAVAEIQTGTPLRFASTGTLPGGLATSTVYYAIYVSSTTIKVATTLANAQAGTAINLTSTGSGTHTVRWGMQFSDNDEIWLTGRKGELTLFWNTDHPTEQDADFLELIPGTDSNNTITGAAKSNNRLFLFTKNSSTKWDGANLVTFSNTVGCISHNSIQNIEDDWLIWVDASGRVRARNDASGQQEDISRAIRNNIMKNLTIAQLQASSAVTFDNSYKLYVGSVNSEQTRVVYDFDSNTWEIEKHPIAPLLQSVDDSTGVLKPYFVSSNGKLYIDETGNDDNGSVIPFEVEMGRDLFGSEQLKKYDGIFIYSENAVGLKVYGSVDGKQYKVLGQITNDVQYIKFDEARKLTDRLDRGTSISIKIAGSVGGKRHKIYGHVTYYSVEENIPHARR